MLKAKVAGRWLFIDGILVAVFGLIHLGFAPTVYNDISSEFGLDMSLALIYMFIVAGLSLILAACIVIISARKFIERDRLAGTMIITVGVYILVGGLGAVMAMPRNVFSYILLGLGVMEILPAIFYWKPSWQLKHEKLGDEDVSIPAN